jgi:ABC-type multidrug transport system ATPase subunit
MEIKIIQEHKSINPPCEFDLPNFSVLTGKNGSGKTHLLEAIADNAKSQVYINGTLIKNVRYIGFNGLNPNIAETCDPQTIIQHIKNSWTNYSNGVISYRQNEPSNNDINRLCDYIGSDDNSRKYVIRTIEGTKKDFDKLTEDDFSDYFDISYLGQNDFFTAQFALIFKNYHKRQEENDYNEYRQAKGKIVSKPVLTKKEFEEKFGIPPWDFVNKILLETKIPYEVNSPIGTRLESNFTFKLKDRSAGFEISSMDLSTGEKVLMSLALAIYNTGGDLGKPDLLLLDEPDAGLHPSMSKMMVDVLNKNIVLDNKIPTVISTHSPTTIIASDGISIYQMIRGNNIPTKIATQQAVEILSSDIPFLKISNDKRRQVFVESKYDVNYYEILTNIYARIEHLPSEPIYLPARTSNGSNCTDVIDIVNNLSKNGNDQVYGIIDWDTTNPSAGKIIVLGENERYAIENYLLDPLLMGLLFLRERKLNFSDFTLTSYSNYSDINKLTQADAQLIVDKVLNDLGLFSTNIKPCNFQNGWSLNISQEFNLHQGHDLEALYKSKYRFLNSYQREDGLKKDIIEKVINDYPSFAPRQIFETILKIK